MNKIQLGRELQRKELEYQVQYHLNNIIEQIKADGITDIGRAQGKYGAPVSSIIRKGVTEAYDIGADYTDSQFNFFGVTQEEIQEENRTVEDITSDFIIKFWRKVNILMHRNDVLLQKYDFEPRSELNSNYMATSTAIGLVTRGMAYGTVNKLRHLQQFRGNSLAASPLKKAAMIVEDQVMWNAIGDNNTCEECEELDGELFPFDDAPIPSEICLGGDNCRCSLDVVPGEEEEYEDLEIEAAEEEI